ncbi:MAG: hypothetical protein J5729_05770 [Bacteroidaceae bacterium]|nr:hypothetical protein [Bacteroidaceae bacterium]
MKKILALLIMFNVHWAILNAQYSTLNDQTIRLFCDGDKCSELTFKVTGEGTVHVRWANGVEGDYSHGMLPGQCYKDTITITMPATITGFDCEGYCISWIDVSGAPCLVSLNCADNQLAALDVDSLPMLDELRCSGNRIDKLSTAQNANLHYLDCADNYLSDLDLSGNPRLEVLCCSGNPISRLSLTANDALRGLWNTNGCIETLDLSLCRSINSLVLSSGRLRQLTLCAPSLLYDLWVDNNLLTSLDLRGTDALYSANLSNNRLGSLDLRNFSTKTKIHLLDVSNNRLPFSSFYPYTKVENYVCGLQQPIYSGYDSLRINELYEFSNLVTNAAGAKIGVLTAYDAQSDEELEKGSSGKDYQYLIGRVRFWHELDSTYFVITASKYPDLEIHTNAFVVYDPEAVGIHDTTLNPDNVQSSIYDLSGYRVNAMLPRGVYILNRKKVLYRP